MIVCALFYYVKASAITATNIRSTLLNLFSRLTTQTSSPNMGEEVSLQIPGGDQARGGAIMLPPKPAINTPKNTVRKAANPTGTETTGFVS